MVDSKGIPREIAMKICEQIREENRKNRFSAQAMQCWDCVTFTGGDTSKMCVSGGDGCGLVNARYRKMLAQQI
jgi:hypothetical protein